MSDSLKTLDDLLFGSPLLKRLQIVAFPLHFPDVLARAEQFAITHDLSREDGYRAAFDHLVAGKKISDFR